MKKIILSLTNCLEGKEPVLLCYFSYEYNKWSATFMLVNKMMTNLIWMTNCKVNLLLWCPPVVFFFFFLLWQITQVGFLGLENHPTWAAWWIAQAAVFLIYMGKLKCLRIKWVLISNSMAEQKWHVAVKQSRSPLGGASLVSFPGFK